MVNKGIFAYLSKLSDDDLDKLVASVKASRKPATSVKAEPKASPVKAESNDKLEQERLRGLYRESMEKRWGKDGSMVDYCVKKVDRFVEIDGKIFDLEKPSIKTHFCFGYGYCGVSSEEDHENASKMAEHASKDYEYFKTENLKKLDEEIKELEDPKNKFIFKVNEDDNRLGRFENVYDIYHCGPKELKPNERLATAEEIKQYVEACKIVRANFEKRLNTYLKRYGTSKLRTWSYLVD